MIRLLCFLLALCFGTEACASVTTRVHAHINGVVVPNPPPPFDQTVTIRGTQTADLSTTVSTAIASASTTELIGLKYVGPIKAAIWQYPDCGTGNTCTFRKRELLSYLTAQTQGATDGAAAGTWTLTGSFGSYVIAFDISTPEITDCNYGANTAIRFGGCPLYRLTSDPVASDWTVDAAQATTWEIWNGRLMIACRGPGGANPTTTQCPLNNTGTGYSGSGATTAIAVGSRTGTTTVLLHNSAGHGDRTITIHWIAGEWDVAPQPTWAGFPTQLAGQELCPQIGTSMTLRDRIKVEGTAANPQTYLVTSGTNNCGSGTRTIAAGGHVFPTYPAGYGDGTNDADWIVVNCEEPWACRANGIALKHDLWTGNDPALKPGYLRFTGLDTRGVNSGIWDTDQNGSGVQYASYMQYDHSFINGFNTVLNAQRMRDIFITDNWDVVDPTRTFLPSQVALNGCDNIIDGNRLEGVGLDNVHVAIFQCTLGGTKAEFAWNFEIGGAAHGSNQHVDAAQEVWSTTPSITAQDNTGKRSFGNVFAPAGSNGTSPVGMHLYDCWDHYVTGQLGDFNNGVGTCSGTVNTRFLAKGIDAWGTSADIGVKVIPPYQGFFEGDIPGSFGEIAVSHFWVGNLIVTDFADAMIGKYASPGSVARYNTISNVFLSHGTYFSFGAGSPFAQISGLGAQMTMEGNIVAGSIGAGALGTNFPAVTPATGFGNIASADGSQYTDPTHTGSTSGKNLLLLQTWLDMYAPTGAAACGGHVCGAVGNGKIDIRGRQILDATIFDVTAGANPPRCTNQGVFDLTHTGTGKTAGDVFSTGVAATFTNSPSSVTHNWFRQIQTGAITLVAANAASYTLVAGDFSAGSTVSIFGLDYGTNADGTGPCITATSFQIKP